MSEMGVNTLSGLGWTRILWMGTILPPAPSANFTAASTMAVPLLSHQGRQVLCCTRPHRGGIVQDHAE